MAHLTIAFAGSSYRFSGLVPEQLASVRSRFDPLVRSDETIPDVEVDIHYTPADSTPTEQSTWSEVKNLFHE